MKAELATAFVCVLLIVLDPEVIGRGAALLLPSSAPQKEQNRTGSRAPKPMEDENSIGPLKGENVALGGRATQSSILGGVWSHQGYLAHAINAIDGNQDPNFIHGSCTHTDYDYGPWWRVDLLRMYDVYAISITSRDGFSERMKGAEILVGNSLTNYGNNNERCGYITGIAPGTTQTFQCNGMVGRYVNVVIRDRKEHLTLCEVQVFAEPESQNHGK